MPVRAHGSLLAARYRVLGRLGAGGMASVLLCHDQRLDRQVAVKRLHADGPADTEARFVREAKLGAAMNHPNLVSVFDTEVDDEGVLIVMEYVEGESLARLLRRGPLYPEGVARIARDLGAALDHVHGQGVVHRDVKPANVLLRADGVAKLADLGIAVAADQTRITRSGTVLGSAAYMAPEQLEGGEVGPAVDVYALATVCFEALAGERAREGRTPVEIAHGIATEGPPDVRDHVPWAPAEAAEALARGMARDPRDRPSSAGELAGAVAGALEQGDPGGVPPAPTTARLAPTSARAAPSAGPAPSASPAGTAASRSASRAGASPSRTAPAPAAPFLGEPARRRPLGRVLAPLLLLVAVAGVAAAVLLSGGGEDGSGERAQRDDGSGQNAGAGDERGAGEQSGAGEARGGEEGGPGAERGASESSGQSAEEAPEQPAPSEPAPTEEEPAEPTPAIDPARGTELNEEGFALMGQGNYEAAVPVLQEAVGSWPEESRDINYAYALYNLGASLNRSGRAAEAIPYLEKRLTWPNQRGVVEKELDAARANAQG
jgi:eukaryotic-like serine/threonine-protein kinase